MGRRRHTVEQIISKLREVEIAQSKGLTIPEAARQIWGHRADVRNSSPHPVWRRVGIYVSSGRAAEWLESGQGDGTGFFDGGVGGCEEVGGRVDVVEASGLHQVTCPPEIAPLPM